MSSFNRLKKKSALIRKGSQLPTRGLRWLRKSVAATADYEAAPPVLANSFPKSGTHLLLQCLQALPGAVFYGSFLATEPSITLRERTPRKLCSMIGNMAPGELEPGHLVYAPEFSEALSGINAVHYFIYRDLRDVVLSEANYLSRMTRWHRLHRHYKAMTSDEERLSATIVGARFGPTLRHPDIAARFARYAGWLDDPSVFTVKFEDLVGDKREEVLRQMMGFYLSRTGLELDVDELAGAAAANIAPELSHTFHKGGSGRWREAFSDEHVEQFKQVAGGLLVELGYESDLGW